MERVDLAHENGKAPEQSWISGGPQSPFRSTVRVGQLADGRWYAERVGRAASVRDKQQGACVYESGDRGRYFAVATARRWMRTVGGEWVEDQAPRIGTIAT